MSGGIPWLFRSSSRPGPACSSTFAPLLVSKGCSYDLSWVPVVLLGVALGLRRVGQEDQGLRRDQLKRHRQHLVLAMAHLRVAFEGSPVAAAAVVARLMDLDQEGEVELDTQQKDHGPESSMARCFAWKRGSAGQAKQRCQWYSRAVAAAGQ